MGIFSGIGRWFARDSYKTMEQTDEENKEIQEALSMTAKEMELLKLVEQTAQVLHGEAQQTEAKVINLATKMKITKRQIDAEMALGKYGAVLQNALKRTKGKSITDLGLTERETLRAALEDLRKKLAGLLAESAEIKKEAEEEKKMGSVVVDDISKQVENANAIILAYQRINESAKRVVSDLGKIERSSDKITAATLDVQTRVSALLGDFRQEKQA